MFAGAVLGIATAGGVAVGGGDVGVALGTSVGGDVGVGSAWPPPPHAARRRAGARNRAEGWTPLDNRIKAASDRSSWIPMIDAHRLAKVLYGLDDS